MEGQRFQVLSYPATDASSDFEGYRALASIGNSLAFAVEREATGLFLRVVRTDQVSPAAAGNIKSGLADAADTVTLVRSLPQLTRAIAGLSGQVAQKPGGISPLGFAGGSPTLGALTDLDGAVRTVLLDPIAEFLPEPGAGTQPAQAGLARLLDDLDQVFLCRF